MSSGGIVRSSSWEEFGPVTDISCAVDNEWFEDEQLRQESLRPATAQGINVFYNRLFHLCLYMGVILDPNSHVISDLGRSLSSEETLKPPVDDDAPSCLSLNLHEVSYLDESPRIYSYPSSPYYVYVLEQLAIFRTQPRQLSLIIHSPFRLVLSLFC